MPCRTQEVGDIIYLVTIYQLVFFQESDVKSLDLSLTLDSLLSCRLMTEEVNA
jgi:hypothetical protein